MSDTIIIGESDSNFAKELSNYLRSGNFQILLIINPDEIIDRLRQDSSVVLVVLDTMLPSLDGYDLCKKILAHPDCEDFPVILTNSVGSELDRVLALELGASDFIKKPYNPRELLLRIKNILKMSHKSSANNDPVFKVGDFILDEKKHQVSVKGEEIQFTTMEFKLLLYLARRFGQLQSKAEILKQVWGYDDSVSSRTVDTHVQRIRRKIGSMRYHLETIRGFGYRLK
jgi:two-component system phosphate regulon response regulator PhoB